MADIVRLSIVYDTSQAAAGLNNLNNRLGGATVSSKKMASAALGLAQALQTGNISASALTNRLALLGGKAGAVGIALAVTAALLLLWKRHADAARDMAWKFADQLRDTKRAIDDLFRINEKSPLQTQIEKITDAITELDRELAKERSGGIWDILKGSAGALGHAIANPSSIGQFLKKLWFGAEKPEVRRQRDALARELEDLTPEHLAGTLSLRTLNQFNRINALGALTQTPISRQLSEEVGVLEDQLKKLWELGFRPGSEQIDSTVKSLLQYTAALRKAERAENLMRSGLQTMADALEDFVITGTASFTDFLNNILRLLYRDFTGSLIDSILRHQIPGGDLASGAAKDTAGVVKSASLASNVTFNVTAIDAQGVAQFFDQNGPRLAAVVAGQADRSRAIRRRFLHV